RPSSRKYPFIEFKPAREIGNDLLRIDGLSVAVGGGVAVGGKKNPQHHSRFRDCLDTLSSMPISIMANTIDVPP
ncbi:MAG: hypothetical protein LBK41_02585, partial [Clostridiales bacterium]|nr:hypothetical protein [Clostridiales bacterium]